MFLYRNNLDTCNAAATPPARSAVQDQGAPAGQCAPECAAAQSQVVPRKNRGAFLLVHRGFVVRGAECWKKVQAYILQFIISITQGQMTHKSLVRLYRTSVYAGGCQGEVRFSKLLLGAIHRYQHRVIMVGLSIYKYQHSKIFKSLKPIQGILLGLFHSREVLLVDFRLAFFTCFQPLIRLKDFSPSGLASHGESVAFNPPRLRFPPL